MRYVDHRNLKIEIEINSSNGVGSAKVIVKPSSYDKTLTCVIETLKEIFNSVGYKINDFSFQTNNSLIEIILHFKLSEHQSNRLSQTNSRYQLT